MLQKPLFFLTVPLTSSTISSIYVANYTRENRPLTTTTSIDRRETETTNLLILTCWAVMSSRAHLDGLAAVPSTCKTCKRLGTCKTVCRPNKVRRVWIPCSSWARVLGGVYCSTWAVMPERTVHRRGCQSILWTRHPCCAQNTMRTFLRIAFVW